MHRKFSSIASGLCARARGRWELAKIFDFMNTTYSISRWIDAFFIFSEKTRTSHFADHIFINPKNFSVNLRIVERIFYKFTMHTARRPANHQGKKMSGFRGRRRAVGPIYNNGYTTQYMVLEHLKSTSSSLQRSRRTHWAHSYAYGGLRGASRQFQLSVGLHQSRYIFLHHRRIPARAESQSPGEDGPAEEAQEPGERCRGCEGTRLPEWWAKADTAGLHGSIRYIIVSQHAVAEARADGCAHIETASGLWWTSSASRSDSFRDPS